MHQYEQPQQQLESSNCFSYLFFTFMLKLLKKGKSKFLDYSDLYQLDQIMTYDYHLKKFNAYKEQKTKEGWSFPKIIIRWLIPFWYFIFVGFLVGNLMNIANPFLLKAMIDWLVEDDSSMTKGYLVFAGIALIAIIKPFFNQHGMRAGFRVSVLANIILYGMYF